MDAINEEIYDSIYDSIYLTPYQAAICAATTPVVLCKAGNRMGTTTGFANLCKQYTNKEDLIVLFCGSKHYNEYRKIIYPNKYTEEASPKNIIHRECMSHENIGGILRSLLGCTFERCVVVVDDIPLHGDFEDFLNELKPRLRPSVKDILKVRVKEVNGLDVRYKGWYDEDGNYVDTFAGLDFKMISGECIDVK